MLCIMLTSAIIVDKKDNVATAVRALTGGERIDVEADSGIVEITLVQAIPFGHKFALGNIEIGGAVIKYGEIIGLATEEIRKGEWVHVHNVEGRKGRGD